MTARQLILMLEDCKTPDAQVLIFDPDSDPKDAWQPVTGCVYSGEGKDIKLYCDED